MVGEILPMQSIQERLDAGEGLLNISRIIQYTMQDPLKLRLVMPKGSLAPHLP